MLTLFPSWAHILTLWITSCQFGFLRYYIQKAYCRVLSPYVKTDQAGLGRGEKLNLTWLYLRPQVTPHGGSSRVRKAFRHFPHWDKDGRPMYLHRDALHRLIECGLLPERGWTPMRNSFQLSIAPEEGLTWEPAAAHIHRRSEMRVSSLKRGYKLHNTASTTPANKLFALNSGSKVSFCGNAT